MEISEVGGLIVMCLVGTWLVLEILDKGRRPRG